MSSPPLVSVIVTCFNRQAYLAEALDSILEQRLTDYEIVLVDDGSTDDSARIAGEYAERHGDRLRYHHQTNRGAAAAKNTGVRLAAGRYIAFLDSDDRWTPDKLETQLRHVESHPDIRVRFAHGRQFPSPELAPEQRARLHCPEQPMPAPVSGTLLIERDDFLRIGPFREELRVGIDVEWNLRARLRAGHRDAAGGAAAAPRPSRQFRFHRAGHPQTAHRHPQGTPRPDARAQARRAD